MQNIVEWEEVNFSYEEDNKTKNAPTMQPVKNT